MLARLLYSYCPGLMAGHKVFQNSIVLLPIGSFEDHGSLTPALDTLLALEASCTASRICGYPVAWPLGYGFSPEHSWSISFDEDEAARIVLRVYSMLEAKARAVIVVDGHYGHREAIRRLIPNYVNVWDVLEELGIAGFERQLEFEKIFAYGRADSILAEVGRRICMYASKANPHKL